MDHLHLDIQPSFSSSTIKKTILFKIPTSSKRHKLALHYAPQKTNCDTPI